MKKSRQQEIDSAAQCLISKTLTKWVVNSQRDEDFAKDYLVEIVDSNGDLTGQSFFVQLKGAEKPRFSKGRKYASFPLETKYAAYYSDKVNQLPVFLVVVDVKKDQGWWVFIQPILHKSSTWRQNKTLTIRVPIENDLRDLSKLEKAVEDAKEWLRKRHPLAVGEAIDAEKERLIAIDPRFLPQLSLDGSLQHWTFNPKEPVDFTLHFKGDFEDFKKRLNDLREKGSPAEFEPGEAWLTGSPLFEEKRAQGFRIECDLKEPGEMTMVTKDADGNELGRLSELPGVITGGTKEQWYESTQVDSLLHIKIGPMGKNLGGTVNLTVSYKVWNGFRLSQLPYFDRLFRVFSTLPNSSATEIECLHKGIAFFNASLRLQELEFVQGLATLFISLSHAREICKKFDVDPIWNLDAFTQDDYETIEELYGIFFQGGSTSMLRTGLTGRIEDVEAFDRTKWPDNVTVTGHYIYTLLGEKIDVGRLNRKMTNMVGVRKKSAITLKPTAKSELTVTQAAPETAQGN